MTNPTFAEAVAEASPAAAENLAPVTSSIAVNGAPTFTEITDPTPGGAFTAADLAKAREQEKQKLYPQIDHLKEELAALKRKDEEREADEAARRAAAEAEARKAEESDLDVRSLLERKEQEWAQQLEDEKREREAAFALLDRERQFAEITNYRTSRIEAERENIIPELIDLVAGNTSDEIEQSIASLKDRSERILEAAQQAVTSARRDLPGTRITTPASGPLDTNSENRSFSADDIKNMSMSEYQKNRERLLGKTSRGSGLFG